MKKDKLVFYILEIFILLFLIFTLFVENIFNKILISIFLVVVYIITNKTLKTKKTASISNSREVYKMMIIFAILYLGIFYLMGMFVGFHKSTVSFSISNLFKYIIPIIVIVITTELLREKFLSTNNKYSKVLTLIWTVFVDMVIYANAYSINSLDELLRVIGYILFSSIACNLLYNYLSVRYTSKSIIAYRLITILYMYFIPYIPEVYIYMRSFLRMLYPFIIYTIVEYSYSRTSYASSRRNRRQNYLFYTLLIIVMTCLIGLISCKFKYGILVIGSESMTGTIDMGDVILYKRYDKQTIKKDDIIVFQKDNMLLVHRIIRIKKTDTSYQYYTKGDANKSMDTGFVNDSKIKGKVLFKIKGIGRPTLWLHEVFS